MIKLTVGQPGAGMTYPNCTPRAVNPAILLGSLLAGEPEACTLKNRNLDVTGRLVVKRGSTVQFPFSDQWERGAWSVKVDRVRDGAFWHSGFATPSFLPCCRVRVIG